MGPNSLGCTVANLSVSGYSVGYSVALVLSPLAAVAATFLSRRRLNEGKIEGSAKARKEAFYC
jgi:hypothetical protein